MYEYKQKLKENESKAVANSAIQKESRKTQRWEMNGKDHRETKMMKLTGNRWLNATIQRKLVRDRLNVVGETHNESQPRREEEKEYSKRVIGQNSGYWLEYDFKLDKDKIWGDPKHLRLMTNGILVDKYFETLSEEIETTMMEKKMSTNDLLEVGKKFKKGEKLYFNRLLREINWNYVAKKQGENEISDYLTDRAFNKLISLTYELKGKLDNLIKFLEKPYRGKRIEDVYDLALIMCLRLKECGETAIVKGETKEFDVTKERSKAMDYAATRGKRYLGVWKIGQGHVEDIENMHPDKKIQYNLVNKTEFNKDLKRKNNPLLKLIKK